MLVRVEAKTEGWVKLVDEDADYEMHFKESVLTTDFQKVLDMFNNYVAMLKRR